MVDNGGLLAASAQVRSERDGEIEARAHVFFRAMQAMGYAAMNVGPHDLMAGVGFLRKTARRYHLPLVSANIVAKKGRKLVFEPWRIAKVGALKIGLFGLVSGSPPAYGARFLDQGLSIEEPIPAAKRAVLALEEKGCDIIVLLSMLKKAEVEDLAAQVPGVTLIIGSETMDMTMKPQPMGKAFFVGTFMKGKYVAEIVLHPLDRKDRYVAANQRAALQSERADVAREVQSFQSQIDATVGPNAPLQLTPTTRKQLEQRFAAARARLQRITLDLEAALPPPNGSSTIDLEMRALGNAVPADPKVEGWVKSFQKKYPKKGH